MLQLWIHRTEILQEQVNGIHLPLVEDCRCGLERRRIHVRTKGRQGNNAKQPDFPLIEAEKLS